MKKTSRPRHAPAILVAILGLACNSSTPFDGETPVIVGPIATMSATSVLVLDEKHPDACGIAFDFGADVQVFDDGTRKDVSVLRGGQRVSVFGTIFPIKPCPGRGVADGVLLLH